MTTPCNPKSQGAQCWICPQCHDDKHHVPGDERCLKHQIKNLTLANRDLQDWFDDARDEAERLRARATEAESSDIYEFDMGYVFARSDPYYHIRWDLEKPATIRSATMEEAHSKLRAILGEPDRLQRIVTRVKKIRPAASHQADEAEKAGGGYE